MEKKGWDLYTGVEELYKENEEARTKKRLTNLGSIAIFLNHRQVVAFEELLVFPIHGAGGLYKIARGARNDRFVFIPKKKK